MNVYDFDGTIYKGDSSVDFYLFSLKKNPRLIRFIPKQLSGFIKYFFRRINKTELKEYYFSFIKGVDTTKMVVLFWNDNYNKIQSWYLEKKLADDIIISASPRFLLYPICKKLKIKNLIASDVDVSDGSFKSKNCKGYEKVLRLKNEYNIEHIDEFYSDSYSDEPLASISERAFIVKKGKINKWSEFR